MTDLNLFRDHVPAAPFQWRSADGDFWHPDHMETRHVFYTVRMIWNHSVPEDMRVGQNVRLYRFGEFYTADYMKQAVLALGRELMTRKDLAPWQRRELGQIAAYFRDDLFTVVHTLTGPRVALPAPNS